MAGSTGLIRGFSGFGNARTQDRPVAIRLGGDADGWTPLEGSEVDILDDGPNPTLALQAGVDYEVTWRNLDGSPHNFAVLDETGEPIVRSAVVSEQGTTRVVSFTAAESMAEYYCEGHPTAMRGDLRVGNGAESATTPTASPTGFFKEGTRVGARIVADGMTAPTDYAEPDDGSGRRFVADQTGEVWVVTDDGRRDEPFLDVSDRIVALGRFDGDYADPQQEYDERGLLGIAFHPSFAATGKFYLHYSAPPGSVDRALPADNWDHWAVISEFQVSADGRDGRPDSERRLLEMASPQYDNDAGPIAFGPDGFLFVPTGDGGGRNDDMYGHVEDWYEPTGGGNGQDVTENLLGSVLRIDVDQRNGDRPYGVPDDNPFVGTDGRDEIYAYGFRNPHGVSVDSGGAVFVADAGQHAFAEADVVEQGGNYGWNVTEGTHCHSTGRRGDPTWTGECPNREPDRGPYDGAPFQDPIVEFPHLYRGESVGVTIVGGHRYERDGIDDLQGTYVYGAWTTDPARREPKGRVLTARPPEDLDGGGETAAGTVTPTEREATTGTETGTGERDAGTVPRGELWEMAELRFAGTEDGSLPYFVCAFGQGGEGGVYVLVNQRGVPKGETGAVLELVPAGQGDELDATSDAA